ncbi:oligosaccharide flippase family protein [Parvularcula maris]|uniref:Oligosaccharide flippase family protein n=1 Tax=Parvularcula maris TaxID=2965077 RepID=A0A9X2L9D2_9PROT|nr:oligosaccharide flippase family protein [Parvularcula maris]MCQ8185442.1 oligosaccharide flippase family protein [Parvularcula maris]
MNVSANSLQNLAGRYREKLLGSPAMRQLFRRSAGAGSWLTIDIAVQTLLRLLSNFIMVRLLAPEAFGLVAVAFSLVTLLGMMTDVGLSGNVIRSDRGEDPAFLRTVWSTQIIRNTTIFLVVQCLAALLYFNQGSVPAESLYALDITPFFISVAACSILIAGFASTTLLVSLRTLELKRVTLIQITSKVLSLFVMIGAAVLGCGPWSLLIGTIFQTVFITIASHTIIPGVRMGFGFERAAFDEIFSFGKWILLASLCTYLLTQADQVLFGWLFDARTFSLYGVVMIWVRAGTNLIRTIVQKLCLPALSECRRNSPQQLIGVYNRFRLMADLVCGGAFLGFLFLGEFALNLFLPADYEEATKFVPFVAPLFIAPSFGLLKQLLLSEGDSQTHAVGELTGAVLALIGIPLAYVYFGTLPTVFAFVILSLAAVPITLINLRAIHRVSLWGEARILLMAAGGGALYLMTH